MDEFGDRWCPGFGSGIYAEREFLHFHDFICFDFVVGWVCVIRQAMEPGNSLILKEAPRSKTEPIMDSMMVLGTVIQSVTTTACVLVAYIAGLQVSISLIYLPRFTLYNISICFIFWNSDAFSIELGHT